VLDEEQHTDILPGAGPLQAFIRAQDEQRRRHGIGHRRILGHHRYAPPGRDRHSGPWIEQVAQAPAIGADRPLGLRAGRGGPVSQMEPGSRCIPVPRMGDRYFPVITGPILPEHHHLAAEVEHSRRDATSPECPTRLAERGAFSKPAGVDPRRGVAAGGRSVRRVKDETVHATGLARLRDGGGRKYSTLSPEVPRINERPDRGIEGPAGEASPPCSFLQ
jgi:hypothetical protein